MFHDTPAASRLRPSCPDKLEYFTLQRAPLTTQQSRTANPCWETENEPGAVYTGRRLTPSRSLGSTARTMPRENPKTFSARKSTVTLLNSQPRMISPPTHPSARMKPSKVAAERKDLLRGECHRKILLVSEGGAAVAVAAAVATGGAIAPDGGATEDDARETALSETPVCAAAAGGGEGLSIGVADRCRSGTTALTFGCGTKDGWKTVNRLSSTNLRRVQFLMCTLASSSSFTRLYLALSLRTANTKHSVSSLPFTSAA